MQSHKSYEFRFNLGALYLIRGERELALAQFELTKQANFNESEWQNLFKGPTQIKETTLLGANDVLPV